MSNMSSAYLCATAMYASLLPSLRKISEMGTSSAATPKDYGQYLQKPQEEKKKMTGIEILTMSCVVVCIVVAYCGYRDAKNN